MKREWSFGSEMMEVNTGYSHSNEKQPSDCRKSADKGKKPAEKDASASAFVNHAAIAWHENRKRWTGDKSQQSRKICKDQVIRPCRSLSNERRCLICGTCLSCAIFFGSWFATYEELLLTNEPFSQPIPLPEMVDFLVDIWHNDGLFD